MVTFKLWRDTELIKIQINYVEKILFNPKRVSVNTLLKQIDLNRDEKAYFEKVLNFYGPFEITAYDEREIMCEKVRAILTRKTQKLRDFYDLFVLHNNGGAVRDFENEILEKIRAGLVQRCP